MTRFVKIIIYRPINLLVYRYLLPSSSIVATADKKTLTEAFNETNPSWLCFPLRGFLSARKVHSWSLNSPCQIVTTSGLLERTANAHTVRQNREWKNKTKTSSLGFLELFVAHSHGGSSNDVCRTGTFDRWQWIITVGVRVQLHPHAMSVFCDERQTIGEADSLPKKKHSVWREWFSATNATGFRWKRCVRSTVGRCC